MLQKKQLILFSTVGFMFVIAVTILFLLPDKNQLSLEGFNQNLKIGDIKIGMPEEEVIELLGYGDFIHGFGGHGRHYKEQGIQLSFPGETDNDLHGRVGGFELQSPEYSVYSIKVGEERESAVQKLLSHGFTESEFSENIFVQGEFMIGLHGESAIEFIQVWFADKDLTDRSY